MKMKMKMAELIHKGPPTLYPGRAPALLVQPPGISTPSCIATLQEKQEKERIVLGTALSPAIYSRRLGRQLLAELTHRTCGTNLVKRWLSLCSVF